jgi:hypothetical protein
MGGVKMEGRGRFGRSGPVSQAPAMGIRTKKPLPKVTAEGGGRGEALLGPLPIAGTSETGPDRQKRPRPSILPPPIWVSLQTLIGEALTHSL